MTHRAAFWTVLVIALFPIAAAAASAPAAAPAPPGLEQFLASLQPPADAPPAALVAPQSLSPLQGARPAAGCGCQAQHQQCCLECSGNNFCSQNPGCRTICADDLTFCNCQCLGTC